MKNFFKKLKAVDEAIKSLEENPEQWKISEFSAKNETTDSYIWYSNEMYGLTFIHNNVTYVDGVTYFSTALGWLVPWRRKIVSKTIEAAIHRGITPFNSHTK